FAKVYPVFNLDQMDGVPHREPRAPATTKEMHDRMQSLVKGMQADGLRIETGGDRAFYRPSDDRIQMPRPEQFQSLPHYYSTLLHEMGHATGAANRLNREGITGKDAGFGSPSYAREELVAELASFFAAAETGIPRQPDDQHAAYLQSWSKALREDPNALFKAAKDAGKAVDYLLEKEKVLEIAKDKVIASPNLHHGVTDGPVMAVDDRTDILVQQSGRLAVAHRRGVAPTAKSGDELRIAYRHGFGKSEDLGPIRERQREHARSQAKDGGRGLSIPGGGDR
ncbi:ArdC family protein, partial [Acidithiobacillus sp.]|uniref:ArdC family protein n=1 Tax=Acidithiobacillus sp. TaxID=1872118 RepID=UPI003CFF70EA